MKKINWLGIGRDLLLFGIVIFAISSWQSRDLLEADGSVQVDPQQLVGLNGQTQALTEPGKRTLVYFFAPWCNVCALSIGNLDYIESDDLNIVRVALDYQTSNEVQSFVDRYEVEGRVLLGTDFHKRQFQVPGYPTYYLLDEESNVVSSSFGYSTALGLKLKNYLNRD